MARKAKISGILPRPRQILPKRKTFWEIEEAKKVKQGFIDPSMIPKGVDAKWVPKHEKSADERIALSAKNPTKPRSTNTETQRWRNMTSDMRRDYFKSSLKSQESRDEQNLKKREEQFKLAREARLKIDHDKQSDATRLTLPTIESFFKGDFVKPRTKEQKEELMMKRQANRLHHEIKHKEQKAGEALELYQQSLDFIVTEEELDKAIAKEFQTVESSNRLPSSKAFPDLVAQAREKMTSELMGTTLNKRPGLPQVEEALKPKSDDVSSS